MKKYIYSTIIAILLILISFSKAQGIGIGESLPDIEITSIINYPQTSITLSGLKGKSVILDFWATWCAPCVEAFPKMDSLQKKFDDKLQIFLVNNQNEKVATDFLNKINKVKNISLPCVLNDTQLNTIFQHRVIPHYVWISPDGIVQAITGAEQVTENNIYSLIRNEKLALRTKSDSKIDTDLNKPVFLDSPQIYFTENDVLYRNKKETKYSSIITRYNPMINGYTNRNSFSDSTAPRIISINSTIAWLYMYAYGNGEWKNLDIDNVKLLASEPVKYNSSLWKGKYESDEFEKYVADNVFSYELIVYPADSSNIFKIMQADLEKYFDLRGSFEKVFKKAWVLLRLDKEDRVASRGGKEEELFNAYGVHYRNRPLSWLLNDIENFQESVPIINKTGFSDDKRIDLDITANLKDINEINRELNKYGLQFVEENSYQDMLVLKEVKNN